MAPNTDIATRALIVTLKSPVGGKTSAQISEETGLSIRQINRIYARAIKRGFEPNHRPFILKDEWLEDASRSGRPSKKTPENTEKIIAKPGGNRHLSYHSLTDPKESRFQEDQADEEAWTDEEDERAAP
ncbi:hypothetical protein B0H67DRAFT_578355 [Lasiosphaeris hirsuta]|uniref:Uncharacterized protein n=1 Tax=Lasiosphaeris hirsuta TaxID=260670 RepID=A0AA40DV24_9PEZI|nr:hypothetical protein B0H67DRAFT_578355 [Lasiosphaeris hirsuta]